MLSPEEVIPFFQHDDPLVRGLALTYFRDTYDIGPLKAEHYWAVIDRFGENKDTIGFAANLSGRPETEASFRRLVLALRGTPAEGFEHHYQRAARNMEIEALAGNRAELLACPQLRPSVREHLELRLKLLDEPPAVAWDRLMEHGRELENEESGDLDLSLGEALAEAAARGGREICERAMLMLADRSAAEDWREIYAVNVLGLARYEPAVDALVQTLAIDADILREETNRALARIATPRVIERITEFYPGKPWHVRLYARNSPMHIKRPESEEALLKFLGVESVLEADPNHEDEGPPLVTEVLTDLTELISLAGLEESRRQIETDPDDPENLGLCESLIGAAIMLGLTLPEEAEWRARLKARDESLANETFEEMLARMSVRLRKEGALDSVDNEFGQGNFADAPELGGILPDYRTDPIVPIRNTAPKIGRNDPCTCGSGKKYKKCCGK